MTSTAPEFRLLHLPRVALGNVLRNFNNGNLIMFSLCSKRCYLVVKSYRHCFTGIHVTLLRDHLDFNLSVNDSRNVSFQIGKGIELNDFRVLVLDGRAIWTKQVFSLRVVTLQSIVIFYSKGSPNTRSIFTNWNWVLDVKVLIDHMVETIRVPFETVKFFMDDFDNYRDFVQCFPKCDNLRICGVEPISEEDITYLKEHVEHNHFYKNGNHQ